MESSNANQTKIQEDSPELTECSQFCNSSISIIDVMKNLFSQRFSVKEILTYSVKLIGVLILLFYSFQFKIFYLFIVFIIFVLLILYISRHLFSKTSISQIGSNLKTKISPKLSKLINTKYE